MVGIPAGNKNIKTSELKLLNTHREDLHRLFLRLRGDKLRRFVERASHEEWKRWHKLARESAPLAQMHLQPWLVTDLTTLSIRLHILRSEESLR